MFIFEVAKKCNNHLKTNKSFIKLTEMFTFLVKSLKKNSNYSNDWSKKKLFLIIYN